MNRQKPSMREKLAQKFDLPADIAANQPRMTIIGYRELVIYNHKGITEYGSDKISIATAGATVHITGVDLTVKAMTGENISVTGQLMGIAFSW